MDTTLFVISPVYVWGGLAIVALIVMELLRERWAISPTRHRRHHEDEPSRPDHQDADRRHDDHRPRAA